MKISVILPHVIRKPGGGTKIMYEFADQLKGLGHDVTVYNCMETSFFKLGWINYFLKRTYYTFFKHAAWFKFKNNVKSVIVSKVSNEAIDDADIIYFTWWALAYDLQILKTAKGKMFNLIQDLEFWTGHQEMVIESYKFNNITKLTYSDHIKRYIENLGEKLGKVSISIDQNLFRIHTPIAQRIPGSICMMYSKEERKGSKFGLEALTILKQQFPFLKVYLFGTPNSPEGLPEGFHYYQTPDNLPEIMNSCSVFLTPSIWEGYGIPGIEAMHCGCAVVCSDAEGHMMYAKNDETAIVFNVGVTDNIVQALSKLLRDDTERLRIANNGNQFILTQKSWKDCANEVAGIFASGIIETNQTVAQ